MSPCVRPWDLGMKGVWTPESPLWPFCARRRRKRFLLCHGAAGHRSGWATSEPGTASGNSLRTRVGGTGWGAILSVTGGRRAGTEPHSCLQVGRSKAAQRCLLGAMPPSPLWPRLGGLLPEPGAPCPLLPLPSGAYGERPPCALYFLTHRLLQHPYQMRTPVAPLSRWGRRARLQR